MKDKSTGELLTLVAAGLSGRRVPAAVSARDANAELGRRIRAVVTLLERGDVNAALALVKGETGCSPMTHPTDDELRHVWAVAFDEAYAAERDAIGRTIIARQAAYRALFDAGRAAAEQPGEHALVKGIAEAALTGDKP